MFTGAANSKIERAERDETVPIAVIRFVGSKGNSYHYHKSKKGAVLLPSSFPSLNWPLGFLSCSTPQSPYPVIFGGD